MNWMSRIKNPYFIFGIIGLFFTATNINPDTLTSWQLLGNAMYSFVMNPFQIGSFIVALAGIIVNPSTPGFHDSTTTDTSTEKTTNP